MRTGADAGPTVMVGVASLSSLKVMTVSSPAPSPLGENHTGLTVTPLTVALTTTSASVVAVCPYASVASTLTV